jgi:S-DNA-T family DNA segregation ATPase FtsK/SpoIIIE
MNIRAYPKNGKYLYNIAGREPWELPKDEILIPDPPELPNAPSPVSLLTLLLPSVIMIAGSVLTAILMKTGQLFASLPMMLMGLGYPAANLISHNVQKKKYKQQIIERKEAYTQTLRESRNRIERLVEKQRSIMRSEFPPLDQTLSIGLAAGKNKRLWWRKPNQADFLNIRVGTGVSPISFSIEAPRSLNPKDPLSEMPFELIEHYEQISGMPLLVDFKRLGSLAVYSHSRPKVLRLVRRILIDVIVHHSPEDVSLNFLTNRINTLEEWECFKWAPHCHLLDGTQEQLSLLSTTDKINTFLDDLKRIFYERLEELRHSHGDDVKYFGRAYIVVLDDQDIRSHEDIYQIAKEGRKVGIYLIFVGDFNVPASCGVRIGIDTDNRLDYLEYIDTQSAGNRQMGLGELAKKSDVEPLTRTLAGLEVIGSKASVALPDTVRVVDILPGDPYNVNEIVEKWRVQPEEHQLVRFPVGQYVDRDGLATFEIDFRPDDKGGRNSYHAMLIGTTGSGKSIFMQSLVLAAAHQYSPRDINFMFMDFKAGAAELSKISTLPHAVGMVTDLSTALADRALKALESEFKRRQKVFEDIGGISDIWDYNRRFPDQREPFLLVLIDEFAAGIKLLPDLAPRLEQLGKQGRAFGMYFLLANQEVNPEVERLRANASWYILLKVKRQEEMSLIGRHWPILKKRGRGYVKVDTDVVTIQSAYAGLPANVGDHKDSEASEILISTFGPDGDRRELLRYDPVNQIEGESEIQTELEMLMATINEAAFTLNIPKATPIYTEPLNAVIPLSKQVQSQETYRLFNGKEWIHNNGEKNSAYLGLLDIPSQCLQPPFSLSFTGSSGHLWIVGMPGSGKDLVVQSLATSLCLTHNPAEVNLYILEFGAGQLARLSQFPHTGAVIRIHEEERINRLLYFLQETMRIRSDSDWQSAGEPDIYVIVNNIADLYSQNPDQAYELGRFIRSGGSVGIHLIITSNRVSELPHQLSGNISNRIVLQLTDAQEYLDVLGHRMPSLTKRTQGRGYLVQEGTVAECQVAIPDLALSASLQREEPEDNNPHGNKDTALTHLPSLLDTLGVEMQTAWSGKPVKSINAMTEVITLTEFEQTVKKQPKQLSGVSIPIGVDYQRLSPVYVDLRKEGPFWTILGGRQSGKSTSLLSMVYFLEHNFPKKCNLTLMPFKRGLLSQIGTNDHRDLVFGHDTSIEYLNSFTETVNTETDIMHVLLMDDLGIAFSSGNNALINALNQLGDRLNIMSHDNFMIVIADLYGNLKSPQTYNSSFLKLFQQSQAGIFFSMDDSDMQWFNTPINLQKRKSLKWFPGRGFYVSKGKTQFIQSPLVTLDSIKKS